MNVRKTALTAVGYIVTSSNDKYTQQCIEVGLLKALHHLLTDQSANARILNEIIRTMYNITCGPQSHIVSLLRADILPYAMKAILKKNQLDLSASADVLTALAEITKECSKNTEILEYLLECDIFEVLCPFLTMHMESEYSDRVMIDALRCIESILACDDCETHRFAIDFESNGGIGIINRLFQPDLNQEIFELAETIIAEHYMPVRCGNGKCKRWNSKQKELEKWYICEGCCFVHYCSRKCQKLAWNRQNHKYACKILQNLKNG